MFIDLIRKFRNDIQRKVIISEIKITNEWIEDESGLYCCFFEYKKRNNYWDSYGFSEPVPQDVEEYTESQQPLFNDAKFFRFMAQKSINLKGGVSCF